MGGPQARFLPNRDGFGHGVNVVVVLVLGAVVHGASEGIHAAVVVCVLGRRSYVRLHWACAADLSAEHSSEFLGGSSVWGQGLKTQIL